MTISPSGQVKCLTVVKILTSGFTLVYLQIDNKQEIFDKEIVKFK